MIKNLSASIISIIPLIKMEFIFRLTSDLLFHHHPHVFLLLCWWCSNFCRTFCSNVFLVVHCSCPSLLILPFSHINIIYTCKINIILLLLLKLLLFHLHYILMMPSFVCDFFLPIHSTLYSILLYNSFASNTPVLDVAP